MGVHLPRVMLLLDGIGITDGELTRIETRESTTHRSTDISAVQHPPMGKPIYINVTITQVKGDSKDAAA